MTESIDTVGTHHSIQSDSAVKIPVVALISPTSFRLYQVLKVFSLYEVPKEVFKLYQLQKFQKSKVDEYSGTEFVLSNVQAP
ncbi:unnamed protein product [Cuscuta campestris]|uniref:Uncharacterized protein n=1 Tax=Cuscuta campestris TaxID=132261 RepID=A0A484LBL0_9ASTE|nr:unnamed protein product [Cuscuta campestris]